MCECALSSFKLSTQDHNRNCVRKDGENGVLPPDIRTLHSFDVVFDEDLSHSNSSHKNGLVLSNVLLFAVHAKAAILDVTMIKSFEKNRKYRCFCGGR